MKLYHLLAATIGLFSSPLVWGEITNTGDLINQGITPNESAWKNVAPEIKKTSSVLGIELAQNGNLPNGNLLYTINHPTYEGYEFSIQINDGETCTVNNEDEITLNGNGVGPAEYLVSTSATPANGALNCNVDITFIKELPIIPKLVLQNAGKIDLASSLSAIDVKSFELYVGNKNVPHIAVLANGTSNAGVYIYRVEGTGQNITLTKIDYIAFNSTDDVPTSLDFFAGDVDDANQYLIVSYKGKTQSHSKVNVYKWGVEGNPNKFDSGKVVATNGSAATFVKMFKDAQGNDLMLSAHGGDVSRGYNNKNYIYKHTNTGNFTVSTSLNAANAWGGTAFSTKHKTYYGFFNQNNNLTHDGFQNKLTLTSTDNHSLTIDNVCGIVNVEHFSVSDDTGVKDRLLVANSCGVGGASITSQHYVFGGQDENLGAVDTISFGNGSVPANNWKVIKVDDIPYFFPGFKNAISNTQASVYGWCNKDGDDAAREWCNASGENSYIRPYNTTIPLPTGQTSFNNYKWESMQVSNQLYLIRIDATSRANANVQILTVDSR